MKPFRILVADDHEIVRQGIRALLESHPGWEVCAEAVDGCDAVKRARELRPKLALLDISMPNLNGLDAARQIRTFTPPIRVLFLTMHESEEVVRTALEVGARGLVLKSDASRDLVVAVQALQSGSTFFTSSAAQMVLDGYLNRGNHNKRHRNNAFTARERQVVQLLAEGKTSREVAFVLNVSVKTAETHRTNVKRKLNLHSTVDLVRYAVRNNLIQI